MAADLSDPLALSFWPAMTTRFGISSWRSMSAPAAWRSADQSAVFARAASAGGRTDPVERLEQRRPCRA